MDLGAVTLLELNQVPHGKRVAYCLPSGEFISATAAAASCFSSAFAPLAQAQELYGRNLCQFLTPQDIEKLEGYMRGHCSTIQQQQGSTLQTFMASSALQMMVRVQESGLPLWIRIATIPLTLRMSRCIDAVQSMYNPVHLFADSSSFVVSDEDLATALPVATRQQPRSSSSSLESYSAGSSFASPCTSDFYIPSGDEDALWGDKPVAFDDVMLPLELKDSPRHARDRRHGKRTESSVSTELADDEELSAEDESLADFAFEADWAGEVAHESLRRSSADLTLRAAPVN